MELVVGTSGGSGSAAVAFCFPFLLLDVGVGGNAERVAEVCWGCDVLGPLINSENLLWARRVLRERPSSTEERITRSCSALYYPKHK